MVMSQVICVINYLMTSTISRLERIYGDQPKKSIFFLIEVSEKIDFKLKKDKNKTVLIGMGRMWI